MTYKTTVFINDTHVGSQVGLISDTARDGDDRKIGMIHDQEIIFDHWKETAKKWKNPDCMVLLGDLVDGRAKYDNSTSVWTPDMDVQAQEFQRLLKYWGKPKTVFSIYGTLTHTRDATIKVENQIARDLNAKREHGKYTTFDRFVNLAPDKTLNTDKEKIFHLAHHVGSTRVWMYRGTAISKAMAMMMLNETHYIEKKRKVFGIVRGHVHYYWIEKSTSRVMQCLPCWQNKTEFLYKIAPESAPDIGCVRYLIHDDGTFEDELLALPSKGLRRDVQQG